MTCSPPPSWPTTRSEPTVGGRVRQNLFGNGILWVRSGWGGAPLRPYVDRTPQGDGSEVLVASAPGRERLGCGHGLTERVAAGGFDAVSRPPSESLAGFVSLRFGLPRSGKRQAARPRWTRPAGVREQPSIMRQGQRQRLGVGDERCDEYRDWDRRHEHQIRWSVRFRKALARIPSLGRGVGWSGREFRER